MFISGECRLRIPKGDVRNVLITGEKRAVFALQETGCSIPPYRDYTFSFPGVRVEQMETLPCSGLLSLGCDGIKRILAAPDASGIEEVLNLIDPNLLADYRSIRTD